MVRDYNHGEPIAATITTTVDSPANSGLGSSSALVVALVDAFRAVLRLPLGQYEVAQLAFDIERRDLSLLGGRQDQYSATFGGANFIEFYENNRVIVNPLRLSDQIRNELEASLVICLSGGKRTPEPIIAEQIAGVTGRSVSTLDALHRLKTDAVAMKNALLLGDIEGMAGILEDSWKAKQLTASGVSNENIERLYEVAFANGALAGKVSGAGGGGFVMFIVPPEDRLGLTIALSAAGGQAGSVKFTERGCETWQQRVSR
jgi:D-glycero-alpha-D-manno-heptose-7-phosphate kinase